MMNFPILSREQRLELLGAGILLLVVIGLAGWYMATHQAPPPYAPIPEAGPVAPTLPKPQTIEEHAQYYDVEAMYPAQTVLLDSVGPEADAAAIIVMRTFVEKTVADFKTEGRFDRLSVEDLQIMGYEDGRKQALSIEYGSFGGARTSAYVYTVYVDTFGAHPNIFYRTFTFDTQSGKELSLGDLFQSKAPYLERLSETSRSELTKSLGPDANLEYLNQGTAPEAVNFQNFLIEGDMLTLIFVPYQVGPYALGTQYVSVPLTQLKDILKPSYLP